MLVLSRKADEQIRIGDDIVLTVTRIGYRNVRLGIEAPANVKIVRAELEELNGKAADAGPEDDASAAA